MITVDEAGVIVDVRHRDGGDQLIDRFGVAGEVTDIVRDDDEVAVSVRQGSATVRVRQSFAAGWTTRISAGSAGPVTLETPTGVTPWLVCAGTDGWLVLLAPTAGPLLAARVTSGRLIDVTTAGITGDAERPLTLQWDWFASPAELATRLPVGLPARGAYRDSSVVAIRSDPDTAIAVGSGLSLDDSEEGGDPGEALLFGGSRTPQPIALHSARGTTTTTVRWAPADSELLTSAAQLILQGPRTPASVVRVPDLTAALVLQRLQGSSPTETAAEALDLYTARVLDLDPDDGDLSWWCNYLVGEAERLRDDEALVRATACLDRAMAVARSTGVVPGGLGLAAARLTVAALLSGRPGPDPLGAVAALAAQHPDPSSPGWWEAHLVTAQLVGGPRPRRLDQIESLIGFGRRLGAGLPGSAVRPLPQQEHAQLVGLLRLVPEGLTDRLSQDWGVALGELVDRAGAALAADLDGQPPGPAHRWLAVSDPPL